MAGKEFQQFGLLLGNKLLFLCLPFRVLDIAVDRQLWPHRNGEEGELELPVELELAQEACRVLGMWRSIRLSSRVSVATSIFLIRFILEVLGQSDWRSARKQYANDT